MLEKIKEKLNLKKVLEKFPITIIVVWIMTLLLTIFMDELSDLQEIMLCASFFAISTFFIETITDHKSPKRIIGYVISLVFSIIMTFLIKEINEKTTFGLILAKFSICYFIALPILTMYYNYKKSEVTFEKYVTDVFINIIKSSVIYGILAIGILLIGLVFIYLILDGEGYELLLRLEILLFGAYYIPKIIYSFADTKNEVRKICKNSYKICIRNISNNSICNNIFIYSKNYNIKRHSI